MPPPREPDIVLTWLRAIVLPATHVDQIHANVPIFCQCELFVCRGWKTAAQNGHLWRQICTVLWPAMPPCSDYRSFYFQRTKQCRPKTSPRKWCQNLHLLLATKWGPTGAQAALDGWFHYCLPLSDGKLESVMHEAHTDANAPNPQQVFHNTYHLTQLGWKLPGQWNCCGTSGGETNTLFGDDPTDAATHQEVIKAHLFDAQTERLVGPLDVFHDGATIIDKLPHLQVITAGMPRGGCTNSGKRHSIEWSSGDVGLQLAEREGDLGRCFIKSYLRMILMPSSGEAFVRLGFGTISPSLDAELFDVEFEDWPTVVQMLFTCERKSFDAMSSEDDSEDDDDDGDEHWDDDE